MMLFRQGLVISCLALCVLAQNRPPPGVNPQQYNANQVPQHMQPPPQHNPQYQQNQQYQQNAPGVPPAQYQQQQQFQQPPQQQQQQFQQPPQQPPPQQQQQQFQQPPQQQQQQFQQPPPPPPQQQQQQPPPQQQHQQPPPQQQHRQPVQPVQGAHANGAQAGHQHHGGQRVNLHNPNLSQERDHMKEHMDVPLDTAGMSEQELQFHYFKMHDADNNNKLDGQELIKSLFHWHDASNHDGKTDAAHPPPEAKLFGDEELQQMIDPILDQDDKNKDGYIDYPEFVQAQRNAAAAQQTNQV